MEAKQKEKRKKMQVLEMNERGGKKERKRLIMKNNEKCKQGGK